MQTEMEGRKRRYRFIVWTPCLVLFRVALRLYRGYAFRELFDTEDLVFYALLGALWLYDVFGWLKERREEKECIQGEKGAE